MVAAVSPVCSVPAIAGEDPSLGCSLLHEPESPGSRDSDWIAEKLRKESRFRSADSGQIDAAPRDASRAVDAAHGADAIGFRNAERRCAQ
jgi:hypothetical protein